MCLSAAVRPLRRRPAFGTLMAFVFAASTAAFLTFMPMLRQFQNAINEFGRETITFINATNDLSLREAAFDDFARNTLMPPVCANPADASSSLECLTFAEPLPVLSPWSQTNIDAELITIGGSLGRTLNPSNKSEAPMCFVAQVQARAAVLAAGTEWGLNCIMWVPPPTDGKIDSRATRDQTGQLVIRSYRQAPNFDPMNPQFDITSGGENEIVFDDIAALRIFWYDDDPDADGSNWTPEIGWEDRLVCSAVSVNPRCVHSYTEGIFPVGMTGRTFSRSYGLRRAIMFICPPDSADYRNPNGIGDCVDVVTDLTLSDPVGVETGLARVGTYGHHRHEFTF